MYLDMFMRGVDASGLNDFLQIVALARIYPYFGLGTWNKRSLSISLQQTYILRRVYYMIIPVRLRLYQTVYVFQM